jgi:2-methylcitrate dehydratase PrpD
MNLVNVRSIWRRVRQKGKALPVSRELRTIPTITGDAAIAAIHELSGRLTLDTIPEPILVKMRQLLLVGVSWSLLGSRAPEAQEVSHTVRRFSGRAEGCTIFGRAEKTSSATAAFINAAHAQVYDCNDGHVSRGAWHAGRVLIPTACAIAEEVGATGRELLEALVLGYEVAHRASWTNLRDRSDGIGAAAIAARLLKLSPSQWIHAIRLTDQHGPHLYPGPHNFNSDANHLSNGMIARQAVEGAFLAAAGLTADPGPFTLVLESDLPVDGNPASFLLSQVYIKPYIACRLCHTAIDVARALRPQVVGRLDQIRQIDVDFSPEIDFLYRAVSPGAPTKMAHFSMPYSIACALVDGDVNEAQYHPDRIAKDDVQSLQRKVILHGRPGDPSGPRRYLPATVRIRMSDGTELSESRPHARGSSENPLTQEEVHDLFHRWADASIGRERSNRLIDAIRTIDQAADVREVMGLLQVG